MKNRKRSLLVIAIIVILILLGFLAYFVTRNIDNEKVDKKISKEEYYDDMLEKMKKVYEEYYKRISVPQSYDDVSLIIKLGQLEQDGIDIKGFVSYETKVACDKMETYGKYKLKNGKYDLSIIYKCDNDTNYKEESHYKVNLN